MAVVILWFIYLFFPNRAYIQGTEILMAINC